MRAPVLLSLRLPLLGLGCQRRKSPVRRIDDQRRATRRGAPVPPDLVIRKTEVTFRRELGAAIRGCTGCPIPVLFRDLLVGQKLSYS